MQGKWVVYPILLWFLLGTLLAGCGSNHLEAYNRFAIRCAKAGLWKEAVYRWEQVLERDPNYAPAYNNLGVAYEALGEYDKALEAYDQALRLDPKNEAYAWNRRRCLAQKTREPSFQPED